MSTPGGTPGLILERKPGHIEGWQRVSMEQTVSGVRVVVEGSNYRYALAPTRFVLESITEALKAITAAEMASGAVVIGAVGRKALQRLAVAPRTAA